MEYFKLCKSYCRKLAGGKLERVLAYKHRYGIEVIDSYLVDDADSITEVQYVRVKKLILAKILKR